MSPEKPIGDSGDETIQYFENGVVTVRDGKREIWLRPASEAMPGVSQHVTVVMGEC